MSQPSRLRPSRPPAILLFAALVALAACGDATKPSGEWRMSIVSGNDPHDTIESTLAPMIVKVLDPSGAPAQGRSVAFTLQARENVATILTPQPVATDASGQAAAVLKVGLLPDTFTVIATLAGVGDVPPFVEFGARVRAGQPHSVTWQPGPDRPGEAGAALTPAPQVLVVDRNRNAIRELTVTWTLGASSGTIASPTSVTATNGAASVAWTLGATPSEQTLTATAGPIAQTLRVLATTTAPTIQVAVTEPTPTTTISAASVTVWASVQSGAPLASVTARVANGGAVALVRDPSDATLWAGVVPIDGVPAGTQYVQVTAIDGNGARTDVFGAFVRALP